LIVPNLKHNYKPEAGVVISQIKLIVNLINMTLRCQ